MGICLTLLGSPSAFLTYLEAECQFFNQESLAGAIGTIQHEVVVLLDLSERHTLHHTLAGTCIPNFFLHCLPRGGRVVISEHFIPYKWA